MPGTDLIDRLSETQMIHSIVSKLLEKWRSHGLTIRAASLPESFAEFRQRHGVTMPSTMRELYEAVDGMEAHEVDGDQFRFWALDEVRPVDGEAGRAGNADGPFVGYFIFADYCLWSHAYAVRLFAGEADVVLVGGDKPIIVADSFDSFIVNYLTSVDSLFVSR